VSKQLTTDEAIKLLKQAVKLSNISNQNHVDFSLLTADKIDLFQNAMVVVNMAVENGEMTRDELNSKLGIP
jgi:hypothetical protein